MKLSHLALLGVLGVGAYLLFFKKDTGFQLPPKIGPIFYGPYLSGQSVYIPSGQLGVISAVQGTTISPQYIVNTLQGQYMGTYSTGELRPA